MGRCQTAGNLEHHHESAQRRACMAETIGADVRAQSANRARPNAPSLRLHRPADGSERADLTGRGTRQQRRVHFRTGIVLGENNARLWRSVAIRLDGSGSAENDTLP